MHDKPTDNPDLPESDDPTPVEVWAAMPALPAFGLLVDALQGNESILDLGCGTGRLANLLAGRGHDVVAVDSSREMLAHVDPRVRTVLADIRNLDLGERFDSVVLASNLVNTGIDAAREDFMATCARHAAPGGCVFIEHHPPEWIASVQAHERQVGAVTIRMSVLARAGNTFTAVQEYLLGDRRWREHFTAAVVDHQMLDALLARHDLVPETRLTPRWIVARPK